MAENNLGYKILGAALVVGSIIYLVKNGNKGKGNNNVPETQPESLFNDATKEGMPYSIDISKIVFDNPTPPIVGQHNEATNAGFPYSIDIRRVINQSYIDGKNKYDAYLNDSNHSVTLGIPQDPSINWDQAPILTSAIYSSLDGSFLNLKTTGYDYSINDNQWQEMVDTDGDSNYPQGLLKATGVNQKYNTGTYTITTGGGGYLPLQISYNVFIHPDGYYLAIPEKEADVTHNPYSVYSLTDGSFVKLVNDATKVGLPYKVDVTKVIKNPRAGEDGGAYIPNFIYKTNNDSNNDLPADIDEANGTIILITDEHRYMSPHVQTVCIGYTALYVHYDSKTGALVGSEYVSSGEVPDNVGGEQSIDGFMDDDNGNIAVADGMPSSLDFSKLVYDIDPSKLPKGQYPTGLYANKYKVFGSPSGNIVIDKTDENNQYVATYIYDANGNFLSKEID